MGWNFQGLLKFPSTYFLSSFITIFLLIGLLDRFLDFLWFSRFLFKICGLNFQGLNMLIFYIFLSSFVKICLLIAVLDRFLDFVIFVIFKVSWFPYFIKINFYCMTVLYSNFFRYPFMIFELRYLWMLSSLF